MRRYCAPCRAALDQRWTSHSVGASSTQRHPFPPSAHLRCHLRGVNTRSQNGASGARSQELFAEIVTSEFCSVPFAGAIVRYAEPQIRTCLDKLGGVKGENTSGEAGPQRHWCGQAVDISPTMLPAATNLDRSSFTKS